MFKVVGRIIARGEIVGLFIPMEDHELYGIYEVRQIMDELTIAKVGLPAMTDGRFTGIGLNDLMADRPYSVMTEQELASVTEDPKGNLWHPHLGKGTT